MPRGHARGADGAGRVHLSPTVPVSQQDNMSSLQGGAAEDTDMMPSISSYRDYPATQPFIHDSYRRPANKPVKAYPESNRQGQHQLHIHRGRGHLERGWGAHRMG